MAISTYTELKTAIERWAIREGSSIVSGRAAEFVTLAESRLARDLPLRVTQLDTALTGTLSSNELTLPSDFVEPIALFLTTYGVSTKLKPYVAGTIEIGLDNAVPTGWTINEDHIELDAPCDQAHTFTFRYRKSFTLSDASPTNWLLTNHPDVYLAACMAEYFLFDQNTEMAMLWNQRYHSAVAEIAWKDSRSMMATLSTDPMLATGPAYNINTD